jgi:hypothetical protein
MQILNQPPSKHYYPTAHLRILQIDGGQMLVQQWRSTKAKEAPVILRIPVYQATNNKDSNDNTGTVQGDGGKA